MKELPTIDKLDISGKNILVRADLEYVNRNSPRGKATDRIIEYLKGKQTSKIKLIGHKGIPDMANWWDGVEVNFDIRADKREQENSFDMAEELLSGWGVYVNESFAESHREYTSVNALPKLMKSKNLPVCIGLRFMEEITNLERVFENPKRPVIVSISGAKEDKLNYVESFSKFADKILIGGKLPMLVQNSIINNLNENSKIIMADLIADNEDITMHSIEKFEEEIKNAGTIVVSGPMGKFEDEGHRQGTNRILNAVVANRSAYKVAGGGDTEQALQILGLSEGFDWVSVGGGAMLEFLAQGTLPGIEVLH